MKHVEYCELNSKQKENFNYQKVSAILADYGYVTLRLSDDWQGADFIALHIDRSILRVQLKSRLTFKRDYKGKDLWIAFRDKDTWYLYPHDKVLSKVLKTKRIGKTDSWTKRGSYSFPRVPKELGDLLSKYRICAKNSI